MDTVEPPNPQIPRAVRRTRLLRPRAPSDAVARQSLLERLDEGLGRPLVLLATPPGFGKTTLLSDWAARCPIPVAWLSIDAHGDDLHSFVAHVVAAIQTVGQGIGRQVLGLLHLTALPSPRVIAAALDDELLDLTDDIALVLDDYHLITDPSVHEFVGALLDRPPPGLHLVLATRADPPLPLARLRMHGQLSELRATDLRFSAEETTAFFEQSVQLSLDSEAVALVERRADGWVAGLRLAALSLQDGAAPAAVLQAFEDLRLRGLMDFLADEMVATQPEDVRHFLLRTSVVERISAPLAVALLDDGTPEEAAAAMLDRITRANLFLSPLDEDPRWHRYHALFRDALRDRLRASAGERGLAALHARATAWLAGNGLIDEAVHQARAGNDDEAAVLIVEGQIHWALDRDDVPTLESWLRLLHPAALERRPALILARSWIAYLRGRWALHGRLLVEAEASLEAKAQSLDASTVAALQGEIEVARSLHLLDEGDSAASAEAARRALALLPIDRRYVVSLAHYQLAFGELIRGEGAAAVQRLQAFLGTYGGPVDLVFIRMLVALMRIHAYSGNLRESCQVATDVYRLASERGFSSNMLWAAYQLGAIAYQLNDLGAARAHFAAVVADPHQAHATPLRESAFGLALTQRAEGLETEAWLTLDRLQDFLQQTANMEQLAFVRALQRHFSSPEGEVVEAPPQVSSPAWRASSLMGLMGNPIVIRVDALLKLATVEGLDEAEALLEDLLRHARTLHFSAAEIELTALQSVLAETRGQHEDAADTLERALDLAVGEGFVRTFLDRGPPLVSVLRTLRPRSRHGPYIDRLLAAFAAAEAPARVAGAGPVAPRSAPHLPPPFDAAEALTDRELEILGKLAARLSYKEIADALVISPFTVKAHASNIYGKLGASGRREAIGRAQALGLIADTWRT